MGRWVNFSDGPLAQDQGPEMSADVPGPAQSPKIAFGLRCLQAAMRAKSGRTEKHEADRLIGYQEGYVPNDEAAKRAAHNFKEALEVSQPEAGAALHDWLISWADELALKQIREVRAALASQDPTWPKEVVTTQSPKPVMAEPVGDQPRYDWQDRADIDG
jgi:hypothetical protein